jgi:glycosyltransferase involved in cell wall biosynthesis
MRGRPPHYLIASMQLSAIVIAKNEERVIERCLRSLSFCDEIILIDSGSEDGTIELARANNAKVIVEDWRGPATQRNRGLARAQGDWRLLLDADEWVSDELRDEVIALLARDPREPAFRMPRLSSYCGRYMRHSGWWPDYVTRLVRRDGARYEGGMVHERASPCGPPGTLTKPLMHESFRDLEQVLQKINSYSTWGAQDMLRAGKRSSLKAAIGHALWAFIRTYVLRLGFLDGRHGLMLSISNAEGTYYRYAKAMLAEHRRMTGK